MVAIRLETEEKFKRAALRSWKKIFLQESRCKTPPTSPLAREKRRKTWCGNHPGSNYKTLQFMMKPALTRDLWQRDICRPGLPHPRYHGLHPRPRCHGFHRTFSEAALGSPPLTWFLLLLPAFLEPQNRVFCEISCLRVPSIYGREDRAGQKIDPFQILPGWFSGKKNYANRAWSEKKECIFDPSKVRSGCSVASNGSYLLSQLAPACPGIWALNPTQ